ncbi:MAG: adenylate cyclase, partial [Muribaculaceae bacterium]|nr:adenylate cyclase [Muribaculaceae bacterium]
MAFEIERKYLVKNNRYLDIADYYLEIRQGYLCKDPERTVRVRVLDKRGYLTVKGLTVGTKRLEYEYEIPYEDAVEMLELCVGNIIEKRRYILRYKGVRWEVDEFIGKH